MAEYRLAAVLGLPAGHSLSPTIHSHWIKAHAIRASYVPITIEPDDLAAFFSIAPKIGFVGFNVTAPHKEAAYALCDEASPIAERSGSANLIVFRKDGTVFGDSTDGFGFLESVRQESGFTPSGARIAIIGAGGAARAIVEALVAGGAAEIRIANRTLARAEAIAALFDERVKVFAAPADQAAFYDGADLIVNASSFGMHGLSGGAKPWRLPKLSATVVATDLIYAPLRTAFLIDAEAAGARCVDGLGMLLHQARPSFEAWFGPAVDVDAALREEVIRVLNEHAEKQ